MKNSKVLLLLALVVSLISFKANAQDEENVWAVGFGANFVDVSPAGLGNVGDQIKDYLGTQDWQSLSLLSRVYVARYLTSGIVVDAAGSINIVDSANASDKPYYSIDLGARYDLNNLFGHTGWFDPYVKLGLGTAWTDGDGLGLVISPSYGFNTWFNETVGLNFESAYKASTLVGNTTDAIPSGYHFQHSISLVFKFKENQ
ncbi:hypothetical protein AXE80_12725 [Wenyingzhuangia fucanilytica]|uniref:Outer membrane protein beta-barrel domain-containing protein n=1 Tax=Wenyingzhuangia fucanilytica TaxID=1790137 RepID=A0A1B1Y8K7_9FLAO|nr:hypothetical protein [Wenyingzhuangia fucanilytica]ANW97096.1 hypothetical protein AXE80_12725 [Wenyingzhuangia fucanilytica]